MPFVLLLLVALAVGSLVTVLAAHYPHTAGISQPSDALAREVGHELAEHRRLRRLLRGRLDPTAATGLVLTLALLAIFVAGVVIGLLAYLVRTNSELAAIDRSAGQWSVDYRAEWSTEALEAYTWLGDPRLFIPLAIGVAIVEYLRRPSRWIVPFLALVIVGEIYLVNGIKDLLDRVRPEFNPIAETLGPSFPSGHSAGAAAFLGAVALLASRGRTPHQRAIVFGVAAGLAAGVACSRVMLGVHWLSDTVAGVLFGWAWVCVVSIAFGGRLLRFGAPAEQAAEVAERDLQEQRPGHAARNVASYKL